jgi:Mg-chelatase subunit ChlD
MSDWVFKLLGIDPSTIPPGAQTTWVLTQRHWVESWRLFVFIGAAGLAVYGVFALYRRELDTCPRGVRRLLACLRASVLLLLAVVLLGPALAYTTRSEVRPAIVLLADRSASMAAPDSYLDDASAQAPAVALALSPDELRREKPSRQAVLRRALERSDHAGLKSLSARGDLIAIPFADRADLRQAFTLRPTAPPPGEQAGESTPGGVVGPDARELRQLVDALVPTDGTPGHATNLAKSVRDAIRHLAGVPLAGVVVFTDGQHNAAHDDPAAAADELARLGVPLVTVGLGDASRTRNLRVLSLQAEASVWRGDPFKLEALLRQEGLDSATASVELIAEELPDSGDAAGPPLVIETRQVPLASPGGVEGGAGAQQSVTFTHSPQKAGRFRYRVRVAPLPGEQQDTDNEQDLLVTVRSEQARVLLVSGSPSWEYRFLMPLLKRDKSIDVSGWLQTMDVDMPQEGDTVIGTLPKTEAELLQYDLIVMLDPDPMEFNEAWVEALKSFLGRHGGGLLFQAGPKHTSRFFTGFRTRAMVDVMPVRLGDLTSLDVQDLIKSDTQSWPLAAVTSNLDHPLLAFEPDLRANQALWERLPGVYWTFPAQRPKPAAVSLLEHTDPALRDREGRRPLLVAGQYGPGRTVYMGFNSSWRWRRVGKEHDFYTRFWVQAARYLIDGRLLKGKRRGQIGVDSREYVLGDEVKVQATLFDRSYRPVQAESVPLTLREPDGRERPTALKPRAGAPGEFEATIPATRVGLNELSVEVEGDQPGQTTLVQARFKVRLPDLEQRQTTLNRALLTELAQAGGGRYLDIHQLAELAPLFTRPPEVRIRPGRPVELWDTDRLLLLILGLLTVEWAMRKRFKLM